MAEKIGQILIRKGKVTPAQLREALRTQQFFGGYLGSHLINLGFIDEPSLGETLSEIYGVPFVDFETIRRAQRDAIVRVPASLAQRFRIVPLEIDGNRLHVAMLNPRDAVAIGEISGVTGLNVIPFVAPEFRILQALERHYRVKRGSRSAIALRLEDEAVGGPAAVAAERAVYGRSVAELPEDDGRSGARSRAVNEPELGFDGHPIDAEVFPDLGGTAPTAAAADAIPRSLEEWRNREEKEEAPSRPTAGVASTTLSPPPPPRRAPSYLPAGATGLAGTRAIPRPDPQARPAPGSAGPSATPAAGDLERLKTALAAVASRDDLGRELIAFLAWRFRRAAVFVVKQDQILGWIGAGPGIEPEGIASIAVGISAPSVFAPVLESSSACISPLPAGPESGAFCAHMGGPRPEEILLVPVRIAGRLVAILYADNEAESLGPVDLQHWNRVAQSTSIALEILVLRSRLQRV